jgi:hypothetical protein
MGCFTAFSTGFTGLFGVELMCRSFFMRRFSAFARDFPLFILVHRSKAPFALAATVF